MAFRDSQLLVRQYLDTRRSHVTLVVDDGPASGRREDFETAMSVATSIIVARDARRVRHLVRLRRPASSGVTGRLALDSVAGPASAPRPGGLRPPRGRVSPDTSLLFLVSGAASDFEDFQRAGAAFPPEVRRYAVIVDPSAGSRVTETGGLVVVQVADKADLAAPAPVVGR